MVTPSIDGYVVVINARSAPLVAQAVNNVLADGRCGAGTRAILLDLRQQCRDAAQLEADAALIFS